MKRIIGTSLGAGAVALAAGMLAAPAAWAAGSGYGTGTGAPPSTAPGGFTTVVAAKTVGPAGGTLVASVAAAQVSISVPAGTFSGPVQLVLVGPKALVTMPGAVTAFGIQLQSNGTALTGSFSPVTVTVSDPALAVGDQVEEWNGTSFVPYSQGTVGTGVATITVTTDPVFAISTPPAGGVGAAYASATPTAASSGTVPGATSVHTGVPLDGLALLALAGLAISAGSLVALRRS